jgi:hypothetical protein
MDRLRHRAEVVPADQLGARAADAIDSAMAADSPVVVVYGGAIETAEILLELEQRGAEPLLPAGPVELVHAGGGLRAITAAATRATSHAAGRPVLLIMHPLGPETPVGRSQLDCSFAENMPFAAGTAICLFSGPHAAGNGLPALLRHAELRFDGFRLSAENREGRLFAIGLLLDHLDNRIGVRRLAMSPSITALERPEVDQLVERRLRALEPSGSGNVAGESSLDGVCATTCSICEAVSATDGEVTDLLGIARPHIGEALLLEDAGFRPVAWSPTDQPPPSLADLITPGRLARLAEQLLPGVPARVRLGMPAAGHRLVIRIGTGRTLGYLSCIRELQGSASSTSWLRHISAPLASELSRQLDRRRLDRETRRQLVTVLVRGELSPVSARLAITDLVGPLGVRVAALRPAPSRQANLPVSTTASEALADSEALTRRLDGLGLPHGEYEGQTVALIDGTDAATESLVAALNADRVTIGLGSTVSDPAEISASARQAAWTCRMAVSTRRPVLDFAEIGVHRLLLPGAEAGDPEFEQPIHELDRAQRDLGFDAVGTLVGYLDAGGNYRRAARDLTIHVNTLRYRLQRIAGIIQADLDDPEQRFRLQLAARLQAGRRALRESGPG